MSSPEWFKPWFQDTDPGVVETHFLIAGPCVLENDALHSEIAKELIRVGAQVGLPIVFKGSFDKANRTSGTAPRGPGILDGLKLLHNVGCEHGLYVMTDVHEMWQISLVADVVDAIQIPAALCRQTDLLVEVGETKLAVNIKKGQWCGVPEMQGAVEKIRSTGNTNIVVTERGSFFGYGDLVVDMRNFSRLRAACRVPVVLDATHAVQRPGIGALEGSSAGTPDDIELLVLAGVAAGATGLFLEVHPNPRVAPSDSACMLALDQLLPLMEKVAKIWGL